MILVRNGPMAVGENEGKLRRKAARTLGVDGSEIKDLKIIKKSLDARRKNDVHYLFTVALSVRGDERHCCAKPAAKLKFMSLLSTPFPAPKAACVP